jgi:hypothetical protein
MKVRRVAKKNQRVEYYIDNSGSSDDFEYLIKFIQGEYGPLPIKGREGVLLHSFQFDLEEVIVVFYQLNDIGCRFYSKDGNDHPILKEIADKLSGKQR